MNLEYGYPFFTHLDSDIFNQLPGKNKVDDALQKLSESMQDLSALKEVPNPGAKLIPSGTPTLVGEANTVLTFLTLGHKVPKFPITLTTNDVPGPNSPTTPVSNNLRWDEMKDAINKWLDPPDLATSLNLVRQARHKGTAQWFLNGSQYKQWKSSGTLFWIHGMRMSIFLSSRPGC